MSCTDFTFAAQREPLIFPAISGAGARVAA